MSIMRRHSCGRAESEQASEEAVVGGLYALSIGPRVCISIFEYTN